MKRNGLLIVLLIICLLLFGAYLTYDRIISDNTPPQITITEGEQLLRLSVHDDRQLLLQGVSAQDDRDGDVTKWVIVESLDQLNEEDQVVITYAAFDRSGNVSKAQRTVQFTDYTGPRFTLEQPLVFTPNGWVNLLPSVGAEDALDGEIRHRVKVTMLDETSISDEGVHQVMFRVTNSLGDTEELVVGVEVYPNGKYNATLTLTDYILYLPLGAKFSPEDYLDSFTVYGQTVSLQNNIPADLQVQTEGKVNTGVAGVYPVAYTVSRERGNQLSVGYSKLIVVVED